MSSEKIKTYHFREEAMATHFEVLFACDDEKEAKGWSTQCFREIDRLEDLLSRFRDGSDIDRINHLKAGESIFISEACHLCLRQAIEIQILTNGRFDIGIGGFMNLIRDREGRPIHAGEADWQREEDIRKRAGLEIHPDRAAVTCREPGMHLDLGGIGKGFALDQLRVLLLEWGAESFMLSAGGSTILAEGKPAVKAFWKANFSGDSGNLTIPLERESISATGFSVQGSHLIDQTRQVQPSGRRRIWVKSRSAALADALSTAMMLMPEPEIVKTARQLEPVPEVWIEDTNGIRQLKTET